MSDEKKIDDPPQTVYVAGQEDCDGVELEAALDAAELIRQDDVPRLVGVYTLSGIVEVTRHVERTVTVTVKPIPSRSP